MQSPIDPGLMISSDFSSDLLDPSIVTREPEPRCQDAMVNKTGINRLEQKVDNALKKVISILKRYLFSAFNTYILLAGQYFGATKETIAEHSRQCHPNR